MQILLANREKDLTPKGLRNIHYQDGSHRWNESTFVYKGNEAEHVVIPPWFFQESEYFLEHNSSPLQLSATTKDLTSALCLSRCLKQTQRTSSESWHRNQQQFLLLQSCVSDLTQFKYLRQQVANSYLRNARTKAIFCTNINAKVYSLS